MLEVKGLKKTFKMSKKQQKIEKTKEKIKVAVTSLLYFWQVKKDEALS